MVLHNNHRQILGYMPIQRAIVFIALYQYLYRLSITIQAGSNTYQYDANGNMTQRPNQTITYDYDNRPTSINSTTFIYDYSGDRSGRVCLYRLRQFISDKLPYHAATFIDGNVP